MKHIEILYFEGCPGHQRVVELVQSVAAAALVPHRVSEVEVLGDADARRLRFLGSPTIRVDGRDVEPGADERSDFQMSCRIYRSGSAAAGVPDAALVRAALQHD